MRSEPSTVTHLRGLAFGVAAIVFWGVSFVATKAALREISPFTLIFSRFLIGSALLLSIVALRGNLRLPSREQWPRILLMGFIGIFVHQMLQSWGLVYTSAVNTGWLIGLIPIWSAILARRFLGERLGLRRVSGLALGFLGALLVITKGRLSASLLGLPSTFGDLLILVSTLNWAIYTILGRGTLRSLGATRATAFAMLTGCLMLSVPFAAVRGWRELTNLSETTWISVIFLGVCASGLGYFFWYLALERAEASAVASLLYIEPLVTLAAATSLIGETVTVVTIIGGTLVMIGVILVQRLPARAS